MNFLVLLFCLSVGATGALVVWAFTTASADEIARSHHPRHKSNEPISNSRRSL